MRQKVREAHMTGPVLPHVEAIRNQRDNTLRYVAEFVEDLISALLSNLSRDEPLVVGVDDPYNPDALGSADFWRLQSYSVNEFALHIGNCAAYLARRCSDYARSSGGWVYFGDLVEKIAEDGFRYQTYALAAHGLAALQPGT
eukprot:5733473-Pyramimonas_sp.AAC.1